MHSVCYRWAKTWGSLWQTAPPIIQFFLVSTHFKYSSWVCMCCVRNFYWKHLGQTCQRDRWQYNWIWNRKRFRNGLNNSQPVWKRIAHSIWSNKFTSYKCESKFLAYARTLVFGSRSGIWRAWKCWIVHNTKAIHPMPSSCVQADQLVASRCFNFS